MEVILLEKVDNVGNLGEKVNVRPGYGRNFLIPTGKAVSATPENMAAFEARRAELEQAAAGTLAGARARAEALGALGPVSIKRKVGEGGKLFGSVGAADICEALAGVGVEVKKQEVRLPEGAIRQIGEYDIGVHLHSDLDVSIKINVEAED